MGNSSDETDESTPDPRGRPARETAEMQSTLDGAEELFRSSEIFVGLTPEEIREIVHIAEYITLDAGDFLFEQGGTSEAMYIIAEGRLEVRRHTNVGEEVVLAELARGTVVGEMSIIGKGGERSATVEALSSADLYSVSREAFDLLRDQNRPAAYKIILRLAEVLGDRRRRADARIRDVFEDPDEHLDDFEEQVHEMLGSIRKA